MIKTLTNVLKQDKEKFAVPRKVQDIIPVRSIWPDGIFLTGKNKFHPGAGNPFRFDGVTDPEVLENRTKGNGKGIVILIVSALVGAAVGLLLSMSMFS